MATVIQSGQMKATAIRAQALFQQYMKSGNSFFRRNLTGPVPTQASAKKDLERLETTASMPVVEVMDLTRAAGDEVYYDCQKILSGYPFIDDEVYEGQGLPMAFTQGSVKLRHAAFAVAGGGVMTQQRSMQKLDELARSNAINLMLRLHDQRTLVHLCGARGSEADPSWVIPLEGHAKFAGAVSNPLLPPSENRYFVVNGDDISAGVGDLANLASVDTLKLNHLDQLRATLDSAYSSLKPIILPGDKMVDEDMWVLLAPTPCFSDLNTEGKLRNWQAEALARAENAGKKHPLFMGDPGMWNSIAVKKMNRYISFGNGDVVKTTQANGTIRSTTLSGLPAGYRLYRCILLGAQALTTAYGKDTSSGAPFTLSRKMLNHDTIAEYAVRATCGSTKTRFDLPDASGVDVPTDFGVITIDVVAKAY